MNLNSETIIGDSLKTAFEIDTYIWIIKKVKEDTFSADEGFRNCFNHFFRVRQRSGEWYCAFYNLLKKQRTYCQSYRELLEEMAKVPVKRNNGEFSANVEASFVSKLIATIDPNKPIWDQWVLQYLKLDKEWSKFDNAPISERIEKAAGIYLKIEDEYKRFLASEEGKVCIEIFDKFLPEYKKELTDVKKLDYLLWSKRPQKKDQSDFDL